MLALTLRGFGRVPHYRNRGFARQKTRASSSKTATRRWALGGTTPVNVSGGLLSKGYPLGATGIANVYEVSTPPRGEAGER